jgi:hypothetical protein
LSDEVYSSPVVPVFMAASCSGLCQTAAWKICVSPGGKVQDYICVYTYSQNRFQIEIQRTIRVIGLKLLIQFPGIIHKSVYS